MARFYYGGMKRTETRPGAGEIGGGMEKGNDPERANVVLAPAWFHRDPRLPRPEQPLKRDGIVVSFVPFGHWHLAPGEYVDLPDEIPTRIVKEKCPQLLTKAEAIEAGLCNDDGTPRQLRAPKSKQEQSQARD